MRKWHFTNFTGEPKQNFTIVFSNFVYWFQLFIIKNCTILDGSTFASRKSSLRAFILYIYINFTKSVTYWFLIYLMTNTIKIIVLIKITVPAGTGRLYNVKLTSDMTSDRCCILIENENRVDVSIWQQFDVDLTLDFGYTTGSWHRCRTSI